MGLLDILDQGRTDNSAVPYILDSLIINLIGKFNFFSQRIEPCELLSKFLKLIHGPFSFDFGVLEQDFMKVNLNRI